MATVIEGTVSKVNGNGFQVAEREGWLNVSKFAKPGEADIPAVGEQVSITLDKAGFVRKVEEIATPAASAEQQPAQPTVSIIQVGDKDKLIVRQSSLKAAVEILATGGKEVKATEVLNMAEVLEQWVYRAA